MNYLDTLLFAVFPYLAIAIFLLVTIQRYRKEGFSYSSLSSQFLENRYHFWGMVPFHYGLITILTGHLIGFLFPAQVLAWNSVPLRLYIIEVTAFMGALFALVGLVNIIIRRWSSAKTRITSNTADWVVLTLLVLQICSGIFTALFYGWGTSWFASSLAPYLWSILKLGPDITYVVAMPHMVKTHILCAYLMVVLFPFTRLVHLLVVPNPYLWRKPQYVRWNWNRRTIRTTTHLPTRK